MLRSSLSLLGGCRRLAAAAGAAAPRPCPGLRGGGGVGKLQVVTFSCQRSTTYCKGEIFKRPRSSFQSSGLCCGSLQKQDSRPRLEVQERRLRGLRFAVGLRVAGPRDTEVGVGAKSHPKPRTPDTVGKRWSSERQPETGHLSTAPWPLCLAAAAGRGRRLGHFWGM